MNCQFRSSVLQTDRYEEYPKLKELVNRKDNLVAMRATPPYYLKVDVTAFFTACAQKFVD